MQGKPKIRAESSGKRIIYTILPYTLSFCSYFSSSVYLSVHIFQLEMAGLLSDMVSDGTFRYSASFYFIIYT